MLFYVYYFFVTLSRYFVTIYNKYPPKTQNDIQGRTELGRPGLFTFLGGVPIGKYLILWGFRVSTVV